MTATITSPNYAGSATGTFVINKAAAVRLGNLMGDLHRLAAVAHGHHGAGGLEHILTGAPDTKASSYCGHRHDQQSQLHRLGQRHLRHRAELTRNPEVSLNVR